MKWISIATLFGCGSSKEKAAQSASAGPLEITWRVETSSRSWLSTTGNSDIKDITSYFKVKYQGKTIRLDAAEGPIDEFWQAFILKDAPRPAILAGKHSMFLFTEENGQLKTTPLDEQSGDFARYQWLDSENGQPESDKRVGLGDDSANSRFLTGGNLLLVNGRTIVDVQTLQVFPIDKDSWEILQTLDDYHSRNNPARALSPDKKQIVFVGERARRDNRLEFEYALVVVNFEQNKAYYVPFDQTDTRFQTIWDATRPWLDTFFEWTKDKSGEEKIVLRKLKQLPLWQGRLHEDYYAEKPGLTDEYNLFPVQPSMVPKFLDFLKQTFHAQDVVSEDVGGNTSTSMNMEGMVIKTYFQPEEKSLGLYMGTKTPAGYDLVRRIGEGFNAELSKGKYQEDFGRYD